MSLFEKLTTVPTFIRNALSVTHTCAKYLNADIPVGINPLADGYVSEIRISTQFWIDPQTPEQYEVQLRISKQIIIRHLYGDVLDQLIPIKRSIANGELREALKLVEALETSIIDS